jgi:hypothetical protein
MDKREGQPRQSSLPSSLHPHIVTRPHPQIPQPRSSSSSRIGHVQHGEAERGEGQSDDSLYQLRPFAPSLLPATFGDDSRRPSGIYGRRETDSPEPGGTFDEHDGGDTPRTFIPFPRRATNRHVVAPSSIPHGLPSIRSVFNEPFPSYAYTVSSYLPPIAHPETTLTPPWQEGEAGPSSLSRSHRDQNHRIGRSERRTRTQPEAPARERIESSLGSRTLERAIGQTDPRNREGAAAQRTHVSDRPAVESGEYLSAQRMFFSLRCAVLLLTIGAITLESDA